MLLSKKNKPQASLDFLSRFLPIRFIAGLRLFHVSDSSVDRHLLQAPSQPHPAVLRMGASHHSHGHQQVCVCVCVCGRMCVFMYSKRKEQLICVWLVCLMTHQLIPWMNCSIQAQIVYPWVPLSLAALQKTSRKGMIVPLSLSFYSRAIQNDMQFICTINLAAPLVICFTSSASLGWQEACEFSGLLL